MRPLDKAANFYAAVQEYSAAMQHMYKTSERATEDDVFALSNAIKRFEAAKRKQDEAETALKAEIARDYLEHKQ